MGSLKFSQQYGNNKISVNQNQKVVTIPVDVVEPGDKHFIGVVQEVTEDGRFICSSSELSDLIECIKGCNANVGDEVIICLMQDGQYVVVARVGGDLGGGSGDSGGGVLPEYGSTTDYIAGKVFAFAGESTPAGCLLCDGSEVSRSDYWELFAAIGTLYGAGDGSTTFNLPNIESRTIIGESDNYAFGSTGGEETHKLAISEIPSHPGHLESNTGASTLGNNTRFLAKDTLGTYGSTARGWWDVSNEIYPAGCSRGGDQPHNNMQPYIVMRYFITTGKGEPASGINPADYVVEWGKTGEWTWRKYASGVADCWLVKTWISSSGFSAWNNGYISNEKLDQRTYPFEFVDSPIVSADFRTPDRDYSMTAVVSKGDKTKSPIVNGFRPSAMDPGYEITWQASVYAIGYIKPISESGGTETIAPTIAEKFDSIEADLDLLKTNKVLWSSYYFMNESQTATLSEAISAQPHGIVLIFSLYGSGAPVDTDFSCFFVPKYQVSKHTPSGVAFGKLSQWEHMAKYLYINDTTITGNGNNSKDSMTVKGVTLSNSKYVLRYVIGV